MLDTESLLKEARRGMESALQHLDHEMARIRTGKAATAILESVMVEYYGSPTPLSQIANISVADSRTLTVQPWERTMINPIERALMEANLGMTPQNDGQIIRLMVPPLTEDRRKEMVKKSKLAGEESKVGIRSCRRDAIETVKKAVKDGYAEDMGKRVEAEIEGLTKGYIDRVDKTIEQKEKDILTV
jgi:ribosome recycling factor